MGPKKFGVAGARLLRWGVDDPLETCHPIYVTLPNLIVPLSYATSVYKYGDLSHKWALCIPPFKVTVTQGR